MFIFTASKNAIVSLISSSVSPGYQIMISFNRRISRTALWEFSTTYKIISHGKGHFIASNPRSGPFRIGGYRDWRYSAKFMRVINNSSEKCLRSGICHKYCW
jgi:hypothetical protein